MIVRRHKIIIYATQQMLIAHLWYGKQYQSQQTYRNLEADYAAFRHYLLQHKKATVEIIVDTVEEEYQLEILPHVRKSVRREMLARKLSQFNRHSKYKTAWFMRQETTTRKEDVFVLLSLTNTSWLQKWITTLQAEQSLLLGIYALPMLSQQMVRQMKIAPPQLLICEHLASGLRQTYLEHGVLRISRLTPIGSMQSSSLLDCYETEIEKMRLYLLSQRIMSDAITLQVMLFNLEADYHALTARLEKSGFECIKSNKQNGIKKSAIRSTDKSIHPDFYSMQLLNGIVQQANLAPAEITKVYYVAQLANQLYMSAAMVVMIGLLVSVSFFLLGMEQNERTHDFTKQADLLRQQHTSIISQSVQSPIAGDDLKTVVTTAQMLSQQTPITLMQVVSAALEEMPEVSLSRLRWMQTNREQIAEEESSDLSQTLNHANGINNGLLQIGFVNVNINPLIDAAQPASASANRLVNHLRADRRVSVVEVIQTPADGQLDLQGNTSHQLTIQPMPLMVKLKIILSQTGSQIDD